MQTGRRRWREFKTVLLLVVVVATSLSCGGSGMGFNLSSRNGAGTAELTGGGIKGAAIMQIREDQIGTLPTWQQELFSDPGWNQPYIAPRAGTPVAPPTYEALEEATTKALAEGVQLNPRYLQGVTKGASWVKDTPSDYLNTETGEYLGVGQWDDPPFGCNSDSSNGSNDNLANAIEDLIDVAAFYASAVLPPYRVSYVREGLCTANYFNTLTGVNKNSSAAVYQVFSSNTSDTLVPADVAEISYRSSLVPNGDPIGGNCTGATAYLVSDYFWRTFNRPLTANACPTGATPLYNILIAPSGPQSTFAHSEWNYTIGAYQPFYFGTISACYGGAWIIGIEGSSSACDKFNNYFIGDYNKFKWYRPIYGVLLKRWLDTAPDAGFSAGKPWDTELGYPVQGPQDFSGAAGQPQVSGLGTYYTWGMYFEKGFVCWVDYDQSLYPGVPDEAQAYRWTGSNVYCPGQYEKIGPTTYFGGTGAGTWLGVNVTVDLMSLPPTPPYWQVEQDSLGTEYHVGLPATNGLAEVSLQMSASGYGGEPRAGDCMYKSYVWAFRDGTMQPASATPYDPLQMQATHTYGNLAVNKQSVYVVRVQVQDSAGNFAYGDSLPIVLGTIGASGGSEILVIRDDEPRNTYNTNYNALILDLIGGGFLYTEVDFSPTVEADFVAGGYEVAIWYRGGPGGAGEPPCLTPWSPIEEDQFNKMLKHKMFLISQAHGSMYRNGSGWSGWNNYWGWDNNQSSQHCAHIDTPLMTHATDQNMGAMSDEINFAGSKTTLSAMFGSDMGIGTPSTPAQNLRLPGLFSTKAAERYGNLQPMLLNWSTGGTDVLQFCARGWYPPMGSPPLPVLVGKPVNPGWTNGLQATNSTGNGGADDGCYGAACLSYGNSSSGYEDSNGNVVWDKAGPGRFWCWGMPYAKLQNHNDLMFNVLLWLEPHLSSNSNTPVWKAYDGWPEIVSVTPGFWTTTSPGPGYQLGTTAVNYVESSQSTPNPLREYHTGQPRTESTPIYTPM